MADRIASQAERLHVPVGVACNNNCLFCMEEDRSTRARLNAFDLRRLRDVLEAHPHAEEVCFTSGEPTLNDALPAFVRTARELGPWRVSLMTNGRRLAYPRFALELVKAGLQQVYVSIHGHQANLHDALTRTPGSFEQTVEGLRNLQCLSRAGVKVHSSTVLTRRNVMVQAEVYAFLTELGVEQIVFNAIQVTGRAMRHAERLVPSYTQVRQGFEQLLMRARDAGQRAFLVDVPMCITEQLADRHRGFVERHVHYELDAHGGGLRRVDSGQLDDRFRVHGVACSACARRLLCPGVYRSYVQRFGWDELKAVEST